MPILGRDSSYYGDGNNSTIGTDLSQNPVFKVNIRTLETPNEQPSNQQKKNSQEERTFNVGDIVSGHPLNDIKKTNTGKIINIKKNEQNLVSYIEILDSESGKKIKLEPQSCFKENPNDKNKVKKDLETQAKFPYSSESLKYVLTYNEFLSS